MTFKANEETQLNHDIFFSVVTVVQDDLAGLKLTRESLEFQTYTKWIHIVIDGSTSSETLVYLKSLPKHNTMYISELDSGIYSAMNKAWKLADPDSFVFYLNARDKFSNSDSLADASFALKGHENPEWGCTTHEEINRDGSGWLCKLVSEPAVTNQLYAFGYRSHQAVVMRASLIKNLGGFNEKYRIAADWDLIVRAILHVIPVEWQKPLAVFERGGVSSMKIIEAHRELMELRKIYLPRSIGSTFYEFLWRAIYLRHFGYSNIFTPVIKFILINDLSKRFQLVTRRILKSVTGSTFRKGTRFRKFLAVPLKLMEFPSGNNLINHLHKKLSLKPLR